MNTKSTTNDPSELLQAVILTKNSLSVYICTPPGAGPTCVAHTATSYSSVWPITTAVVFFDLHFDTRVLLLDDFET